jgi:hypothetical protein
MRIFSYLLPSAPVPDIFSSSTQYPRMIFEAVMKGKDRRRERKICFLKLFSEYMYVITLRNILFQHFYRTKTVLLQLKPGKKPESPIFSAAPT